MQYSHYCMRRREFLNYCQVIICIISTNHQWLGETSSNRVKNVFNTSSGLRKELEKTLEAVLKGISLSSVIKCTGKLIQGKRFWAGTHRFSLELCQDTPAGSLVLWDEHDTGAPLLLDPVLNLPLLEFAESFNMFLFPCFCMKPTLVYKSYGS